MKIILTIVLLLLLGNVLFLNYKVFVEFKNQGKDQKEEGSTQTIHVASPSGEGEKVGSSGIIDSCYPYSCIDLIRQATASSGQKVTTVPKTGVSSSRQPAEFYITFGSGQTKSDEWENIAALSAYIDSTKYSKIKKATFEASMRIQNAHGRVYAQLFNATDGHPVWFSEISMEGDTSQLLVSEPITLDPGSKLYKVQMKTTLRDVSYIEGARVHIITE